MTGQHRPRPRGRTRRWAAELGVTALAATVLASVPVAAPVQAAVVPATWTAQGPGPIRDGQVENVVRSDGVAADDVVGAVQVVVPHPTDAGTAWIGTPNGGVWRTTNATAAQPTWTPLTDQQASLSIGALALDPTVASSTVLVGGTAATSSFGRTSGRLDGLIRTTDGGLTWTPLGAAALAGQSITGVAPRGATIVATSRSGSAGIWRSTDTGATWTRVLATTAFDLARDPSDNTVLYAGGQGGIFRSTDTGATWTDVTGGITTPLDGTTSNVKVTVAQVGGTNVVFTGIVNGGQLAGLWRSTDRGATWTAMDSPQTNDGGVTNGLQPIYDRNGDLKAPTPGGQGGIHFSMLADTVDADLVYLGGDRQPLSGPPGGQSWPNAIGANDFSGRLFRCDSAQAAGSQCTPLTHNGTANNSSPHADSRSMAFDANGAILEGDDGGVYRRTSPRDATGRWETVNGDLSIAAHHSCDYDNVADIVLCGDQDTGASEQSSTGSRTWDTLSAGDGGFVVAADAGGGGSSVRYSSSNSLGAFQRRTCDAANSCASSAPSFTVAGTGGQTIRQVETSAGGQSTLPLYTPVFGNAVDSSRLIVSSGTRVYESTDRLDNLTIINTGQGVTRGVAYGGRQSGSDAPAVLWYGTGSGQLWLRTGTTGGGAAVAGWPAARGAVSDVALDPQNWARAFATNGATVWSTTDAGLTFTDITGTLATEAPGAQVFSVETVPVAGTSELALVAGTDAGVFMTQTQNLGTWAELGQLPNTVSYDVKHDRVDDVLLVGTLGHGAWLLPSASTSLPKADLEITKSDSPDPVMAGEEVFYTVTVKNKGTTAAYGVTVVDTLPAQVQYLSDNAGCTFAATQNRLTCPLGDLAGGASRSFVIKTRVRSDAVVDQPNGTRLVTNTATVGSASVDTDLSNNTATAPTFVQERADLRVTKLCKPDGPLPAGQTGTCTVYVDNLGPSSARSVVLTDANVSDQPFTFGAVTTSSGTCDPPTGGVVRCALGDLAAASPSVPGRATVTVSVTATEATDINDLASVTAATEDPNTANNSATGSIRVTAVTDLSLVKTVPAVATAGTEADVVLTATNAGPSTATGVVVQDLLGSGVSVVSVSGTGGATCNAGVPGDAARPATCSFGNVAPAGVRTMTLRIRFLPATRGLVQNDARVSGTTFDPDLANNLANASTTVVGSADLSLTKVGSPAPVTAGTGLTYTMTVRNAGPSTADAVSVRDTLPAGVTYVSGVDGNGQTVCAFVQPSDVVCNLGTMQPGESTTVFLTANVAPSVASGATLTNTAQVSSVTPDPVPANNSASWSNGVVTSADLWLDETALLRSSNPAPVLVYTLQVHNRSGCETDAQSDPTPTCGAGGPSDAVAVVVTDPLPLDPKKVVVQYLSPGCTYTKTSAPHTVTCSAARIPAGATATFVVEVQVAGSVGTLTNTASITSSGTPDPVAGNDSDTVTSVVKGGTGKRP